MLCEVCGKRIARVLRQAQMKEAHVNMLFTDTDRKQGGPSPKFATTANVHFREKGKCYQHSIQRECIDVC